MSQSNKEMQLRKTCQLYAYVLISQDKDVPDDILESTYSEDYYPVNCVGELSKAIEDLDNDSFEKIVNNKDSQEACDLSSWWTMYKEVERLHNASYASL